MVLAAIIGAGVVALLLTGWYGWFSHVNRRRAIQVLRWLQGALADYGQICSVSWSNSSSVRARLLLSGHAFRHPVLEVHLAPRQLPLQWAIWRWRRRQEPLISQANLTAPPAESLEISRMRWSVFPHGGVSVSAAAPRVTVSTLYISTREIRQSQSSNPIHGVVTTRDFEFLALSFRPTTPHFSATLPLQETMRYPCRELAFIDSLRELARSSSPSRM